MNEKDFEDYLKRDSALSRLYRTGATEHPSEAAVTKVLARVNGPARTLRSAGLPWRFWKWICRYQQSFKQSWTPALAATAAGVVVFAIMAGIRTTPEAETPQVPLTENSGAGHYDSTMNRIVGHGATKGIGSRHNPQAAGKSIGATGMMPPLNEVRDELPASMVSVANPAVSGPSKTATRPASVEDWLVRLEGLLERGRQDEARVFFYAFREQYPFHKVPEGLLERLGI